MVYSTTSSNTGRCSGGHRICSGGHNPFHQCKSSRNFKRRNCRLCNCQIKKHLKQIYNEHFSRSKTNNNIAPIEGTGNLMPPALSPEPAAPATPTEAPSKPLETNDHAKSVFIKTGHLLNSMDAQRLNESDGIYADIYKLYGNVYAENRRLKEKMVALRARMSEDEGSSHASTSESSMDVRPMKKIYKLYKQTVRENYKMQKIILSKS